MKTLKMTTGNTLRIFALAVIFIASACNGSQGKKETQANEETSKVQKVKAPAIGLHEAVLSNNLEAVRQHIEAGTDINEKDALSGATPLIIAASFDKRSIARALIDEGADLSVTNNDGATALHTAAFFCRIEVVQMLLDAKADKDVKNKFGATPRQSVMGNFEEVKPIYEMLQQQLAPMGMQIDTEEIEKNRPVIAMMLQ